MIVRAADGGNSSRKYAGASGSAFWVVDMVHLEWCDASVSEPDQNPGALQLDVAICLESDALDRLGPALRHLIVGLFDQAVPLCLISSDPRVEQLKLGPVRVMIHPRIMWPVAGRRMEEVLTGLSQEPPTLVHAVSRDSYRIAVCIAETFDSDLIVQVHSIADCESIRTLGDARVGAYVAVTRPLSGVLQEQLGIDPKQIDLIRPGVQASSEPACFAMDRRTATVICTAPLEAHTGVDLLIEAVGALAKRGREVLLFLLGQGSRESALRRRVRARELAGRITFARPMGDIAQAMSSADIYVHPSADAAFHVDGLRAMGAGMAVVAFSNPLCDHYRDGETAVLCKEPTAAGLADALEGLMADRAEARRMAMAGLAYVREHHAMSGMAERTAAAYSRLALARATFSIGE